MRASSVSALSRPTYARIGSARGRLAHDLFDHVGGTHRPHEPTTGARKRGEGHDALVAAADELVGGRDVERGLDRLLARLDPVQRSARRGSGLRTRARRASPRARPDARSPRSRAAPARSSRESTSANFRSPAPNADRRGRECDAVGDRLRERRLDRFLGHVHVELGPLADLPRVHGGEHTGRGARTASDRMVRRFPPESNSSCSTPTSPAAVPVDRTARTRRCAALRATAARDDVAGARAAARVRRGSRRRRHRRRRGPTGPRRSSGAGPARPRRARAPGSSPARG